MEELEINNVKFGISGTYTDSVKGFPNDKEDKNYHNEYRITVSNRETKKHTWFKFYGSAHDCELGKTELSKDDLFLCFRCMIDDAIAGLDSFEDFCSNFGYDEDSRQAERIYKACVKKVKKCENIGIYEDDLYKIIDELSEKGVE